MGTVFTGFRYASAFKLSIPSHERTCPISSADGTSLGAAADPEVGNSPNSGKSRDTDSSGGSLVSPDMLIFIRRSAPGTESIYEIGGASSERCNARLYLVKFRMRTPEAIIAMAK